MAAHLVSFHTSRFVHDWVYRLPGAMTIPEQIELDRQPYFHALDKADEACKRGQVDVSAMENVIESLLAKQLTNVYELAAGKMPA